MSRPEHERLQHDCCRLPRCKQLTEALELLQEAEDYLMDNVPTNGWGLCDNVADRRRCELRVRITDAIEHARVASRG